MRDLLAIVRAAAKAGGLAAARLREEEGVEEVGRGSGGDVALKGDLIAEETIIETLKREVESFKLVSEEAGEKNYGQCELYFIVDPLDGSRNYKRGLPFFATSVAAAKGPSLKDVLAGAIYAPMLGLEFYAGKGKGAYLNGRKVRMAQDSEMVVAVNTTPKAYFLPHMLTLALSIKGVVIRALGAASLEIAGVATGWLSAYIDPWFAVRVVDVAAALLLAAEAGAYVSVKGSLTNPPSLSLRERLHVLVANSEHVAELLKEIAVNALGFPPEKLVHGSFLNENGC
ncbi:MAG: inositol monophosphatase family protein [Thermofilaceae archaeon]